MASRMAGRLGELTGAERDRAGRVTVEPDLTLPGHPEVFAIGDMVRVRDPEGGSIALPGVAPVAMQQGRFAALLVHLWYLVGFQNRILVLIRWSISFVTHGRGARLITQGGEAADDLIPPMPPECSRAPSAPGPAWRRGASPRSGRRRRGPARSSRCPAAPRRAARSRASR